MGNAISKVSNVSPIACVHANTEERSNDYLKKHGTVPLEMPSSPYVSTITSLNTQDDEKIEVTGTAPMRNRSAVVDWIKDKWDKVVDFFGGGKQPTNTTPETKQRSVKPRTLERQSPNEIDDDFKYVDITTMDPLKAMITILIQQGELRKEDALLVNQRILQLQDDIKALHNERMQIHAELALVSKKEGVLEKVNIGLTVAQVLAGLASAATVVATAATIATGGAAAPILIITSVLNGILGGGQAFNTWFRGDTREKLERLQGQMIEKTFRKDECQFQIKIDMKDLKKALAALTTHAEMGSSVLAAQSGK